MKKILTAWLLIAALAFPMTAYAVEAETTASMTVSYEYTAPGDTVNEGGGETVTYDYLLTIPANVSIQDVSFVELTMVNNWIPTSKKLIVSVDRAKSYAADGFFYLFKNKGTANEETIQCRVFRSYDGTMSTLQALDNIKQEHEISMVAEYFDGNNRPAFGGFLCFQPMTDDISVSSGTYTGVLYFDIRVVNR